MEAISGHRPPGWVWWLGGPPVHKAGCICQRRGAPGPELGCWDTRQQACRKGHRMSRTPGSSVDKTRPCGAQASDPRAPGNRWAALLVPRATVEWRKQRPGGEVTASQGNQPWAGAGGKQGASGGRRGPRHPEGTTPGAQGLGRARAYLGPNTDTTRSAGHA